MAISSKRDLFSYRVADWLEPRLRLTVGLGMAMGAFYLLGNGILLGGVGALVGVYLVWDALRNASVWLAFRAFRAGELPVVRQGLGQVRWPRLLSATSRSYYHWLRGVLEVADGRYAAARVHLLLAATGRLRSANDRALVQCLLAEAALQAGEAAVAAEHVQMAEALASGTAVERMTAELSGRLASAKHG